MSQKMADVINHLSLNGEIEIDESAFDCVRKYGRGHSVAPQIWIFGLVERLTNHLYLFPVMDRTEETVVKIIQKVCSKGSILYTDGYASYVNLNYYGYTQISVNHEEGHTDEYINKLTGETMKIHTNRIENAWYHFKDHFRIRHGVKRTTLESHILEVMWKRMFGRRDSLQHNFFQHLKEIYDLTGPPKNKYKLPIYKDFDFPESKCKKVPVLNALLSLKASI